MQAVVDSLITSYQKTGTGPVVLFLHGWGDNQATFNILAKELAGKYTVLTVDLPGFGGTQPPQETWGVEDYCEFVAKFLDKIDMKDIYCVVGHSNGGTIAIRGLALRKFDAQKLVLLSSAGVRDVYKGRKKALRIAAKAAKAVTYPLPERLRQKIKKKAYKTIGSDMFVAEHLQETFKRVVTDDVQEEAHKLKLPTLIIYGADDEATPPSFGELYHNAISGSQLKIIDSAEHFVHHDQPQKVSRLLREFLK